MNDTRPEFLQLIRQLARSYQAFEMYSNRHIRHLGLTECQFDIVATLGNTPGMNFRELGEHTLITKGTLTGVVDRLVDRGLVRRDADKSDGRSQIVSLTEAGNQVFAEAFPAHLAHLRSVMQELGDDRMKQMREMLMELENVFRQAEGTE